MIRTSLKLTLIVALGFVITAGLSATAEAKSCCPKAKAKQDCDKAKQCEEAKGCDKAKDCPKAEHCPKAGDCDKSKSCCPHAKKCPKAKDCDKAKDCPQAKDCPHCGCKKADTCPKEKDCPRAKCGKVFGMACPMKLNKIDWLDEEHHPNNGGWLRLFNGKNLNGWKKLQNRPMSWKAEDGMLVNHSAHHGEGQRGVNIYTEEKFDDFAIYYEYRIPEGSNSGVYLRGRYEIQIFDSYQQKDVRNTAVNGAIWAVAVPYKDVDKAPGEWQSVYAKIVDKKITVYLNGALIHDDFKVPFPTGAEIDRKVGQPGPIMLQGDHGDVTFRNMYLKPLGCK
jgi:hypothetical protein